MSRLMLGRVVHCSATVEVLPGDASTWISDGAERSHSPFLFMENNLGVPEKELRRSYLFAVRIFAAARTVSGLHTSSHPTMTPAIQDVIDSSAIIVFMNPAHQTALNARKRLIERKIIDVGQELKLTAALLSSRHCCKQGELWYHRRWLLQRIYPIPNSHQGWSTDITPDSQNFCLAPNDLSVEMKIVTRASDLYPRNYFGWTHRTICIQSALASAMHLTTSYLLNKILANEILSVTQWIESHISDYSAVHHLKFLAHLAEDVESSFLPDDVQRLLPLIRHAVTLVQAFPEHETLWMYLRLFWVEGDATAAFIASFVLPLQNTGMVDERNESRECPCGAQYARRFLEWRNQSYTTAYIAYCTSACVDPGPVDA
jgi:protein prenyltransferase alpha subunit repeat containing protein 1